MRLPPPIITARGDGSRKEVSHWNCAVPGVHRNKRAAIMIHASTLSSRMQVKPLFCTDTENNALRKDTGAATRHADGPGTDTLTPLSREGGENGGGGGGRGAGGGWGGELHVVLRKTRNF